MARELLASGWEHNVWRSKRFPTKVVKTPTLANRLSLIITGLGVQGIKKELADSIEQSQTDGIIIPDSRVFRKSIFGGYVLVQDYIVPDSEGFQNDIYSRLMQSNILHAMSYYLNPENFKVRDQIIYLVDPTKGVAGRLLEHFKIANFSQYVKLRYWYRKQTSDLLTEKTEYLDGFEKAT